MPEYYRVEGNPLPVDEVTSRPAKFWPDGCRPSTRPCRRRATSRRSGCLACRHSAWTVLRGVADRRLRRAPHRCTRARRRRAASPLADSGWPGSTVSARIVMSGFTLFVPRSTLRLQAQGPSVVAARRFRRAAPVLQRRLKDPTAVELADGRARKMSSSPLPIPYHPAGERRLLLGVGPAIGEAHDDRVGNVHAPRGSPEGSSRRVARERGMSRLTLAATAVSRPPRFPIPSPVEPSMRGRPPPAGAPYAHRSASPAVPARPPVTFSRRVASLQ